MTKLCRSGLTVLGILLLAGCSGSENGESPESSYAELVALGWNSFSQAQYQLAADQFEEAKAVDPNESEAYTGRGWSLLKMDGLVGAASEFNTGSGRNNVTADLFAGWAFGLNAQKDYTNSNTQSDQALAMDPGWSFAHGLSLDTGDLHVLRAENYFMVGDFLSSLAEVQILSPTFDADVNTADGQAALAEEIERLKGIV